MVLRILVFMLSASAILAQSLIKAAPEEVGMDPLRLARVDTVIEKAIADGEIPGAVLMVLKDDRIVYHKAYGYRQLVPEKQKMEPRTVFDLASVTKPVATATSAMILIERGELRLLDRIADFVADFKPWTDDSSQSEIPIRVIHLLTHTSGLPPYADVKYLAGKYGSPAPDSLLRHIATVERHHAPGTYFKYSCLNFITLQNVIEKISGTTLQSFAREHIFKPLGMYATDFRPQGELRETCAATELLEGNDLLVGIVHDPLARVMMDGISGNAGLFSNAGDLAVFAAMMLHEGSYNGRRILSPAGVRTLTGLPQGYEKFGRALGWDLNSDYASNQGDLFSERAYGHTGYTGTSLVIDPETQSAVILLTNRAHPYDKGSAVRLRSLVANVVAGAVVKIKN